MAQDLTKPEEAAPNQTASQGSFITAALIAILIGAGGGAAFGYLVMPDGSAPATQEASKEAEPAKPSTSRFPNDALEIEIPSIIVNLQGDPGARVRLDVSIIAAHGTSEASTLKNEVKEDVVAYLKGLSVADIEGARGFQNLRQQLDDRAKIRGRGTILGLLIGGFVIE
jgi:flagellar FliL protein